MAVKELVRALLTLSPIVGMLLAGFALTLNSGDVRTTSGTGFKQTLGNLSHTLLSMLGWIALFLMLHVMLGQHMFRFW